MGVNDWVLLVRSVIPQLCQDPHAPYSQVDFFKVYQDISSALVSISKGNGEALSILATYAKDMGFFEDPASTRFHGCCTKGLAAHSIGVLNKAFDLLAPFGFSGNTDPAWFCGLVVSALYHDLCKAGLYMVDFRNVKNAQGVWNKEPYFRVKDNATGIGHGTESLRRILKCTHLPYEWELAVSWHMGSYGLTSDENIQYMNSCKQYREVLMLHTADMLQVASGGA
jgi:hypothetical protein